VRFEHSLADILDRKKPRQSLIKSMIALRVSLSTAGTAWMEDFLDLNGLDALQGQLARLVTRPKEAGDLTEQIIVEIVKCLRVLMNTDVS
jgi:diaphanous 1